MNDDTRERARQVAHEATGCGGNHGLRCGHSPACNAVTEVLVAFARSDMSARKLTACPHHQVTACNECDRDRGRRDATEETRRLEAELERAKFKANCQCCTDAIPILCGSCADLDARNAARNERLRIAERVEALARSYGEGAGLAGAAMRVLAAELRAEGGGE